MLRTLLLILALSCAASAADAASLSERSPVHPGLWWDATRSGSGFEIHVAPGQLFVIWYTYRDDGTPVWYTAQGAMNAEGVFRGDLLRHRWNGDRHGGYTQVGTLELSRRNIENLDVHWTLTSGGLTSGTLTLVPFPIAGNSPEVDHSGAWFQANTGGYGLTLGEQGEALTGAYYVYDAAGEPTWTFGTNGGQGNRITMNRFRGSCPACTYAAPRIDGEVSVTVAFSDETHLSATVTDTQSTLAPIWRRSGQAMSMITTPSSHRPADRELAHFDSETELKRYLDYALLYPPRQNYGGIEFSPPPPSAVSSTNLIVGGVDEADSVKSDGDVVYAFEVGSTGQRQGRVRAARITRSETGAPQVSPQGSLILSGNPSSRELALARLYLTEQDVIALTSTQPSVYGISGLSIPTPASFVDGVARVEIFRRNGSQAPVSRYFATFDGHLVSSRRIGDSLYLILRRTPTVPGLPLYGTGTSDLAANLARLANTPLAAMLPHISVGTGAPQALITASDVFLPPATSRTATAELIYVTRIDLIDPEQRATFAVVGSIEALSVSPQNLYLATARNDPLYYPDFGFVLPGLASTDIHQIALDREALRVVATGSVEGYIGNDLERAPFRLSERDGRLRVVTTGHWGANGSNRVTILEPSTQAPGTLHVLSYLPNAQRPAPIGKMDEQLYATRFVDDRLYAVTFKKADPLYVIDLADAATPRIAGQVELPGFSEYLHPLPNGLLLGVGKDSVPALSSSGDDFGFAWYQGVKVALFDVVDPTHPRVLDQLVVGKRGTDSAVLHDHHGFAGLTLSDGTFRFGVPVRVHGVTGGEPANPPDNYMYPYVSSALQAFDVRTTGPAQPHLVAFPALVTDRRPSAMISNDDAAVQARSILFPGGVVYVEKGRFWSAGWDSTATPIGPL